jgi:hypothetical protein
MSALAESHPKVQELVQAIHCGELDALRAGIDGLDAGSFWYVDQHGTHKSLLHAAADWPGHWPGVQASIALLLAAGCDVDAKAFNPAKEGGASETALHWAASSDDVLALAALIEHGADVEVTGAVFTGGTPMSDAVIFRKWAAARLLLHHGAKVTIWQAAGLGLLQEVERLQEASSELERDVSLWHACRSGHVDCVARLLQLGARPDWVGPMGWTPRRAAEESEHLAVLQRIDESGSQDVL